MKPKSKKREKIQKKERWIKVCPNCGSDDVTTRGMISGRAFSNVNYCKTCGFQSSLFPEVKAEEVKKLAHKKPKFNPAQAPIIPRTRFPLWIRILFIILLAGMVFGYLNILFGLF
jgi:predicted RNA-binding Zn-ribbon protein involved in translation (DUF1610 family)